MRIVMLWLIIVLTMSAVEGNARSIGFGIKGGWVSSTVITTEYPDPVWNEEIEKYRKNVSGMCWGAFKVIPLRSWLFLQPEILYVQRGWEYNNTSLQWTQTEKVDFIEVPVIGKTSIPLSEFVKPGVYLGPAVAFRISHLHDLWVNGVRVNHSRLHGDEHVTPVVDAGVILGSEIGLGHFHVEIRHEWGLMDNFGIPNDVRDTVADDPYTTKYRVLTLMAGYVL